MRLYHLETKCKFFQILKNNRLFSGLLFCGLKDHVICIEKLVQILECIIRKALFTVSWLLLPSSTSPHHFHMKLQVKVGKGTHEPKAQTVGAYPGFLLLPGQDASPSKGYPPVVHVCC